MSLIKKLASDTAAYGLSSILARLINYVFSFIIVKVVSTADYGEYTKFYAFAGFIMVVLTHGMETAYFRFRTQEGFKEKAFATSITAVTGVSAVFLVLSYVFVNEVAAFALVENHPEYVLYFAWILALDTLAAIPFASLRAHQRPFRFAAVRIINILVYIFFMVLFLFWMPQWYAAQPESSYMSWYRPEIGVGYVFIANLIASVITLLLLATEFKYLKGGPDSTLYKKMIPYALPVMLVGFAGMINEMLDRVMMERLLPFGELRNKELLGIYGFNYKFAMLMTLFLQAYRYAAEPFFFAQAGKEGAKKVYADTMKYFVIAGSFIFLMVTLLLPFIQWVLLQFDPRYGNYFEGDKVVPILLLANLLLGIYFNISTWYKVTDKTHIGALIAIVGALVTLSMNWLLVPSMGYLGAAWATLACYFVMVVIGYWAETKYYPIPYHLPSIFFYLGLATILYLVHLGITQYLQVNLIVDTIISFSFLGIYLLVSYLRELRGRKRVALQ